MFYQRILYNKKKNLFQFFKYNLHEKCIFFAFIDYRLFNMHQNLSGFGQIINNADIEKSDTL